MSRLGAGTACMGGLPVVALLLAVAVLAGCTPATRSAAAADVSVTEPPQAPACDDAQRLDCIATQTETAIVIRNTRLLLSDAAVFDVESLAGTLVPVDAAQPTVDLGTPDSFGIRVHTGRIRLSADQLQHLMNDRVFAGPNARVRRLTIRTDTNRLSLSGQFLRRGWVNFTLAGPVRITGAHTLAVHADSLSVDGQSAQQLMTAAHLLLSDILSLNTQAVSVRGNDLLLDVPAMMPPPALDLTIHATELDSRGLTLVLADRQNRPATARPLVATDTYVLLHGGKLRLGPLHLPDPRVELLPLEAALDAAPNNHTARATRLALDLPNYRDQLARTTISLRSPHTHPTFVVRLPDPESTTRASP